MMRLGYLLISLYILVFSNAYGKNIVLLSSLPAKDHVTTKKIINIFKNEVTNLQNHTVIVIQDADQEHIFRYLNDPETMAFFWVSHGGFKKMRGANRSSIKPSPILFDYNKDNVASSFQSIHPNLKYIAVIGCNSAQILEKTIQKRDDLGFYIPTKKVIATSALKKSLRKFQKHYWGNRYHYLEKDLTEAGIKITIKREIKLNESKSLKVFAGKKLIGILPKGILGEIQTLDFFIPYSENLSRQYLKIVLSSGQSPEDTTDQFGTIEIFNGERSLWKLFAKPDGTAFGVNERIFLFNSEIENITDVQDYILFSAHKGEK